MLPASQKNTLVSRVWNYSSSTKGVAGDVGRYVRCTDDCSPHFSGSEPSQWVQARAGMPIRRRPRQLGEMA